MELKSTELELLHHFLNFNRLKIISLEKLTSNDKIL